MPPLNKKKPFDSKRALKWHRFLDEIRSFFLSEGLIPVETPTLVPCPGTEPSLEFFSTIQKNGKTRKKMWLASSPELHLKRLLCRGALNIFEIKKCYRNNESGPRHLSEFYLLEWYRTNTPLSHIENDLKKLITHLKKKKLILPQLLPFKRLSIKELFQKHCGVDLKPSSKPRDLTQALKKWGIPFKKKWPFEDLFHLLFIHRIEAQIPRDTPLILHHYPPSLRAYSRLTKEGWADRFEFYWQGLELANAFGEVFDPDEQLKIFNLDLKKRKRKEAGLKADTGFIQEIKSKGMPPSSGIALGLERLFMAGLKLPDISKIHPF